MAGIKINTSILEYKHNILQDQYKNIFILRIKKKQM
jgi:hypothetical protein